MISIVHLVSSIE